MHANKFQPLRLSACNSLASASVTNPKLQICNNIPLELLLCIDQPAPLKGSVCSMFRPPPPSDPAPEASVTYMSVKDAVEELRTANLYNKHHEIPSARLSPDWALVHREEQMRLTGHSSLPSPNGRSASVPPMRSGSQRSASVSPMRSGHRAGSDHWATESSTSSVPSHRYQERGQTSGGFSPRGLNSPSTYSYGAEPLNPGATNNEASRVGSLSMFSSQAMSGKISSASFGFGTATREQSMQLYISPAHMRANHGRFSPGPVSYTHLTLPTIPLV